MFFVVAEFFILKRFFNQTNTAVQSAWFSCLIAIFILDLFIFIDITADRSF